MAARSLKCEQCSFIHIVFLMYWCFFYLSSYCMYTENISHKKNLLAPFKQHTHENAFISTYKQKHLELI